MGCVSSKHSKRHAFRDQNSPVKRKIRSTSSLNREVSLEDYHRHLVGLTSSSYGLLKVDALEMSENGKKNTERMGSMNDIYDKLKVLESLDSAPKSWNEVSNALQSLKPGLGRSISMPEQDLSREPGVQETINVADIMQGLEEVASSCSSPLKEVCSTVFLDEKPQPPPAPPLPGIMGTRRHQSLEKPTIQASQVLPSTDNTVAVPKHPASLSNELHKALSGTHYQVSSPSRFYEEILKTEHKSQTRSKGGDRQSQHSLTKASMTANKSIIEDRSVGRENQPALNPSMPSNLLFSTSSRRLKLTLNLEYDSAFLTGTPLSQDMSSPAGSSTRRSLAVDNFTEPGSPLFDPALLASYEKALRDVNKEEWNIVRIGGDEVPERTRLTKEELDMNVEGSSRVCISAEGHSEAGQSNDEADTDTNMKVESCHPLDDFEWKCPPNGEEEVVLYTTTLRGIRKTFEDCNYLRETLHSFNIGIDERDVSMHAVFRNELRELMGRPLPVPRLFVKGRYVGGVDEAIKLHEEGKLSLLLQGLPKNFNTGSCDGCGGMRFVPCLECSGSCKITDQANLVSRCPECNENGLIHCPICS